jgi:hypothetical protein
MKPGNEVVQEFEGWSERVLGRWYGGTTNRFFVGTTASCSVFKKRGTNKSIDPEMRLEMPNLLNRRIG